MSTANPTRGTVEISEYTHISRETGELVSEHLKLLKNQLAILPADERLLIELIPTGQKSIRDVGRLLGVAPGVVCRRWKSVWFRLHRPSVKFLFDSTCSGELMPELRQVGIEHFLLGWPVRRIAEKHQMSEKEMKKLVSFVKGYAKAKGIRM